MALRLVQRTENALVQANLPENPAVQHQLLAHAHKSLQLHRSTLFKAYPQALLETLVQSARQPFSFSSQTIDDEASSMAPFALLGRSGQQAQNDAQRLLQAVAPQVELALASLDALVSAAQGMARVQPESNPLRPENYIRSLLQVVAATQVDAQLSDCWLKFMGQQLGPLLVSEYARAASLLRGQGVVPAQYAVANEDSLAEHQRRRNEQAPRLSGDGMTQGQPQVAQREGLLTLRLLQELMSDQRWIDDGRYTVPQALTDSMLGSFPLTEEAHEQATLQQALSDFGEISELTVRLSQPGGLHTGWSSYSATALETIQHHPSQVAQLYKALDGGQMEGAQTRSSSTSARTLQRMMAHMTMDARLQPSVQHAVRYLEPVLLQLVERDARFFEDRAHPARQLLDELTARSLWFGSETDLGFAQFIQAVNTAVMQLTAMTGVDAQAFAYVLQRMREQWTQVESQSGHSSDLLSDEAPAGLGFTQLTSMRGPLSAALHFADQQSESSEFASMPGSEHIAQAIRRLPSAKGVPEDILDFVTGPWAEVIAHAQSRAAARSSQDSDPGGYLALVPSLLWSVSAHACTDVQRLTLLAQRLQRRLAHGLRSVGRTEAEINALAARLAGLHQDALDAGLAMTGSHYAGLDITPGADYSAESDVLDMLPSMLGSLEGADETLYAPLPDLAPARPATQAVQWPTHPIPTVAMSQAMASAEVQEPPFIANSSETIAATKEPVSVTGQNRPQATEVKVDWPLGTWVELCNERQQLRTRLTWVSPQQTLFLFTAADGSTQSMTRRMRDKLLAQGQLHRLERQG